MYTLLSFLLRSGEPSTVTVELSGLRVDTAVAAARIPCLLLSFRRWGQGAGVKQRFFNLHLLIKPNKPISGIRLSSGISHNRKRIYRIDASARFGLQQLFDNFHDLCQMAFSLTLFSGLPFWYVTMLSSRRPLPASSPLRTVRATFTAYRSNIS